MHRLARLDHQHLWHPFTQMRDWLKREPIVIVSGHGATLRDAHGREYLDANASIWTNLHGHNHPRLNAAIRRQLDRIAHSSALGLANEPASLLGQRLVELANPIPWRKAEARFRSGIDTTRNLGSQRPPVPTASPPSPLRLPDLDRVFFSDDGSTAMEVALKLAYEFARRTGRSRRPRFLCLQEAYHGDTIGAVSLGHIDLFHKPYAGLLFKSDRVMAPYCYRCPFNRAKPETADAREYRKCNWECLGKVEQRFAARKQRGDPFAAMVVEPLIQGAAGMIPQPRGWLRQVADIARGHGADLIADEVMTGFGRTGSAEADTQSPTSSVQSSNFTAQGPKASVQSPEIGHPRPRSAFRTLPRDRLFACHQEGVQPDFLAMAKGLTGGYLPMGATLTTTPVFEAFLGDYGEFKTFFHGHSFTANQLGAAAALASLEVLQSNPSMKARRTLEATLRATLPRLWPLPNVGDIRQVGLIAGIELVRNRRTRQPFDRRERVASRVCEAMSRRGVLTRPVGDVVVLMPPYCTTASQAERIVDTLRDAIIEVLQ